MMQSDQIFALPDHLEYQTLVDALAQDYRVQVGAPTRADVVYLDTFDSRLFNKSYTLWHDGEQLWAQSARDRTKRYCADTSTLPVFRSDIPCGELQQRIAPLLDVRALIPYGTLRLRQIPMRILNADDKTVLRLEWEQYHSGSNHADTSPPSYLRLCPVRGYPKHRKAVSKWLTQHGAAIQEPVAQRALSVLNLQPNPYSAKLQFDFDPMTPAESAMKIILGFLLDVMRQNEAGIIEDIDTEFLHDFRVAVRRTRAALSQIKSVFPESVTSRYKRDFAYLGQCTTRLRDLDVYLLQQDDYTAKLPSAMQADIVPLFDYLSRERRRAHQVFVRQLRSKRYADIMSRWEAFVQTPASLPPAAPAAAFPISQVARQRIGKKSRGVMRLGQQLLHSTDDAKLHDFRIECKKLRYLMEFFAPLFPQTSMTRSIKHVKALQDTLGDYNDLCVQQEALQMWSDPIARQPNGHRALLAMGHLIGVLETDKQGLQRTFPERFKTFVAHFSPPEASL